TALGQAMGASPIAVLTGGGVGGVLLVVGVALACAGLLWTDAIVAKVAS
ncbi:MAG: type ii secretion system integral membrane subunit, partial [Rhodococcus sp. (in: high G+C Gram-positive bacteria)]